MSLTVVQKKELVSKPDKLLKHHSIDELAPFSSDKIRAKILDLGYGGARRALLNLSPKSARILSAAITRTPLPPAGVRIGLPAGVRIGPPAGVRTPRDDFHSGVG